MSNKDLDGVNDTKIVLVSAASTDDYKAAPENDTCRDYQVYY